MVRCECATREAASGWRFRVFRIPHMAHRTIHHVSVDDATIATLCDAADTAKMSLLDFEGWILKDWAERYEELRRKIKAGGS